MQIEKIYRILGLVFVPVLVIGILFKIMHWPGANIMVLSGGVALLGLQIMRLVYNRKHLKNEILRTVVLFSSLGMIACYVFHYPYVLVFLALFTVSFILFKTQSNPTDLSDEILDMERVEVKERKISVIEWVAYLLTILGLVFRLLNFPGAHIIIFCGIGLYLLFRVWKMIRGRTQDEHQNNLEP